MDNVTPLYPDRPKRRLQSVDWLVDRLSLENRDQAYTALRKGHIPAECFIRIGRNYRINPEAVEAWIARGHQVQTEETDLHKKAEAT